MCYSVCVRSCSGILFPLGVWSQTAVRDPVRRQSHILFVWDRIVKQFSEQFEIARSLVVFCSQTRKTQVQIKILGLRV